MSLIVNLMTYPDTSLDNTVFGIHGCKRTLPIPTVISTESDKDEWTRTRLNILIELDMSLSQFIRRIIFCVFYIEIRLTPNKI